MHKFVPVVFFALCAAANAGVIIAPGVAQYPSVYNYNAVYPSPIVSKSVYAAPYKSVHTDESFINGRVGTIHTKKVSSQPAVVGYSGVVHSPVVSYAPVVAQRYVAPSVVAKGVKYVQSAVGWVPEGSGLEGQYVDDQRKRFYDDGSYRPEHY